MKAFFDDNILCHAADKTQGYYTWKPVLWTEGVDNPGLTPVRHTTEEGRSELRKCLVYSRNLVNSTDNSSDDDT